MRYSCDLLITYSTKRKKITGGREINQKSHSLDLIAQSSLTPIHLIVQAKITIFLAIVLVAGTIALSFPSFMTIGAAEAQPFYGIDDSYDDRKSYNKKPYGYDNGYYEPQYQQSYKPDYKPPYPSYGKDDRDKSKDNKVNIKTIKCINTNLNINGNNAGNVSIGNKGQVENAEDGYLGAYSSDDSGGYGGEGYYNDGYNNNKNDKGKGFDCIINNNNNNTNVVVGEQPSVNVTDECEECFAQILNGTELGRLQLALGNGINVTITIGTPQIEINSLEELCDVLEDLTGGEIGFVVNQILTAANIPLTRGEFIELVTCLGTALGITLPSTIGPIRL